MTPPRRFITALALAGAAACRLVVSDATFLAPPAQAAVTSSALPMSRAAASRAAASAVRPGAFCKKSEAGRTARAADGREMRCSTSATDSRHRWRAVK